MTLQQAVTGTSAAQIDPPAAVAQIVAEESAWVPQWALATTAGTLLALPALVGLAYASAPVAACCLVGLVLVMRLIPHALAPSLHHDPTRPRVRRLRTQALTLNVTAGLVMAGTIPITATHPLTVPATVAAVIAWLTANRPVLCHPRLEVTLQGIETLALVALIPAAVWAGQGWWR